MIPFDLFGADVYEKIGQHKAASVGYLLGQLSSVPWRASCMTLIVTSRLKFLIPILIIYRRRTASRFGSPIGL
jgi:hypothetical protein